MDPGFWLERWRTQQIGFHEGQPNDLLVAHADRLRDARSVYVPLCGKAEDLAYLAGRGHDVIGSELAHEAVSAFFTEHGLTPRKDDVQGVARFRAAGVTILEGDALTLTQTHTGVVDGIYDRAALVAIDPSDRERYVEVNARLLRTGGVMLLVSLTYDQSQLEGPPWSVPEEQVRALFEARFQIEKLQTRPADAGPRFAPVASSLLESIYLLTKRG